MLDTLNRPLPKRQISRLLLVDLAVVVVLLVLPIRTSWRQHTEARQGHQDQQTRQTQLTLRIGQARQAEREEPILIGEVRSAAEVLLMNSRRLRQPGESAIIQEDLRRLVERMGLELIGLTAREPLQQPGFQERVFNLRTTGSFQQHLQFIDQIRNSDVFLTFDRLNLQLADPEARPPGLRMEAELRTILVPPVISMADLATILADTLRVANPDEAPPPGSGGRP
jgi:Tfp pilus assembly protein PilO